MYRKKKGKVRGEEANEDDRGRSDSIHAHTTAHSSTHLSRFRSCLQQLATATPWSFLVIQNIYLHSTPAETQHRFHQKGLAHRANVGAGNVLFTSACYIPVLELGH